MAAAVSNENRPSFWSEVGTWRTILFVVLHPYCATLIVKGHFIDEEDEVDESPRLPPIPTKNTDDTIMSLVVWCGITVWSWLATAVLLVSLVWLTVMDGGLHALAWLGFGLLMFAFSAMASLGFANSSDK